MIRNKFFNFINFVLGRIGKQFGSSTAGPIFILGTGRCGTTLLHNIFKTNRKMCIYPTEANELWHPSSYPYSKKKIDTPPIILDPYKFTQLSVNSWPLNHANYIKSVFNGFSLINPSRNVFIVKSAMISFMIPTILTLYQNAKFIHIYRNGISVIESLFLKERQKYLLGASGQDRFLLYCAKYWAACISEIARQDNLLSLTRRNMLYQFSYEELCSDPVQQMINLSNFIGCSIDDFNYDYSKIVSTNYKVKNYSKEKKWEPVLQLIHPVMIQKGYI